MKKVLVSLLLGVTLVGGLVGCGNKAVVEPIENQKVEVKEEGKTTKEETSNKVEQENKEEILDGTIENVIHRPNGDYSLKFDAEIINNRDYGNILKISYDVKNISFTASEWYDASGNIVRDVPICHVDITDSTGFRIIDNNGNVLNYCSIGYENEIIFAEDVYQGTTGHFSQTFFINENVDMDNITILFLPTITKFNVTVKQLES